MDSFYARQPIFNMNNDTVAYELLYRNSIDSTSYNYYDGNNASARVINSAFFGGDPRQIFNGKKVYINFTEDLITNKTALLLPNDLLVVEILEDIRPTPEVIEALSELKQNEYVIAMDDFVYSDETAVFLDYAKIVKIDFRDDREIIEKTATECRKRKKWILAEKIETEEELEYAKSLGALLFQGYYFSKPILVTQKNLTPMQVTFLRLVAKLNNEDASLREVSKIIQTDAAMTLKFLRFVNFLRNDWTEKIKSVHQAVILAGLKRTREFIYFIGLNQINQSGIDEVVTTGFFRAKFCEILSKEITSDSKVTEEMYLMGLMSIVTDRHFDGSDEAVEPLPLSAEIKSGLLGKEGIYGDILKAVLAYENAKWKEVDSFCLDYGIAPQTLSNICLECIQHSNQLTNGIGLY